MSKSAHQVPRRFSAQRVEAKPRACLPRICADYFHRSSWVVRVNEIIRSRCFRGQKSGTVFHYVRDCYDFHPSEPRCLHRDERTHRSRAPDNQVVSGLDTFFDADTMETFLSYITRYILLIQTPYNTENVRPVLNVGEIEAETYP